MLSPTSMNDVKVIGGNVRQAKFDRQLRLWGFDGQAALEGAHVVGIGATPAIAEALKALVLTGVRTVTLVDERAAMADDAAMNFFVPASLVGTSLATAVLKSVCPLGERCLGVSAAVTPEAWVKGYVAAVEQDWQAGRLHCHSVTDDAKVPAPSCGPSNSPRGKQEGDEEDVAALRQFMKSFPTVVGGDDASSPAIPAPSLIFVSERFPDFSPTSALVQTCLHKCYPDVPVVLVRGSGFLGFLQVYCPSRVILQPHNPTQVQMEDLRMFEPFPALQAWFDAHDPDDEALFATGDVDAMTLHSHLPYPCILHHAFRRWWSSLSQAEQAARRQPSSSSLSSPCAPPSIFPLSAKDYRSIAGVVAGMIRRRSPPEEAFIEAIECCTAKLNRPVIHQLPEGLHALLRDPRCANPMLAVAETRARLFPASQDVFAVSHTGCGPAGPLRTSALLLWTCEEVLVWFILHAVALFVTGEIGEEAERNGEKNETGQPPPGDSHGDGGSVETVKAQVSGRSPALRVSTYRLPHCGYVPDFTTTTVWYRELQEIYYAKHCEDVDCIAAKAWEVLLHAAAADTVAIGPATASISGGEHDNLALAAQLEQQLGPVVKPLLTTYTTAMVENIWDLRMVSFSSDYLATQESQWRENLGRRLTWITENIAYDVDTNTSARRAACLAVAFLTKEELQRSTASAAAAKGNDTEVQRVTGQEIAKEAVQLASLARAAESKTEAPDAFVGWLMKDDGPQKMFPKACKEVARWASSSHHSGSSGTGARVLQIPSVAASIGALAAQEAVKLIMRIRVPCGQPMMYDGYTNKVYTL
jgi:hypothetical protein